MAIMIEKGIKKKSIAIAIKVSISKLPSIMLFYQHSSKLKKRRVQTLMQQTIKKYFRLALVLQPVVYIGTALAGSLNDDSNGFNGMQAVLTIPILFLLVVMLIVWQIMRNRYEITNNASQVKVVDRSAILLCGFMLILDMGIFVSVFFGNS